MDGRDGGGIWTSNVRSPVVLSALERARLLTRIHPVAAVGSTQDLALGLAREGCPGGTIVLTDHQVAGRGRSGRPWDDHPDGATLALTVVVDIDALEEGQGGDPVSSVALVPLAVGCAVAAACDVVVPTVRTLRLKWPNDVVHRDGVAAQPRKVSGVLVERERIAAAAGIREVLLIGIGVDVDLRTAGAAPDRIGLSDLAGVSVERPALLAALIEHLDEALDQLRRAPDLLLERYRSISDTVGRRVVVELAGESVVGSASGIDEVGRLLVTTEGGTRAILSGSVRDAPTERTVEEAR